MNPQMAKMLLDRKVYELMESLCAHDLTLAREADPLDQRIANARCADEAAAADRECCLLRECEAALDRLNGHGPYGICEDCEAPIPDKRLLRVPWARRCVKCQEKTECRM